jgi:tripartite-type tricarboxylate transporter receptor subunit TctC
MKNRMRHIAVAAAALVVSHVGTAETVRAQGADAWPQKTVTLVVPFAAGGGTDAFARPFAAWLENRVGQRVIIENKAGAGGTVGASAAAKAAPDGYTFFIGAAHHAIAPALYPKLDYAIEKDFEPVGVLAVVPQVVVVHPEKVQAKTLGELIAAAKASPGKLSYGSAGHGTTHHLAGELFKLVTKTDIVHVPYRGAGPALQDLLAGHIEMMFDGLGSSAEQITGGRLRALAVADTRRAALLPNVPTAAEAGVNGYEVTTWYAVFAPKGTPPAVVARMAELMKEGFASRQMKDAWDRNGSVIPDTFGEALRSLVVSEIGRWDKVVKEANVKLQ